MNRQEYLIACLAEECDEVGQRAMKALRFGLVEVQGGHTQNNAERLAGEVTDVLGVLKMLEDEGLLVVDRSPEALERKRLRVEEFMVRARAVGALV